jgi:hypothetical protein
MVDFDFIPSFDDIDKLVKPDGNITHGKIKIAFENIVKQSCVYISSPDKNSKASLLKKADEKAMQFFIFANTDCELYLTKTKYETAISKIEDAYYCSHPESSSCYRKNGKLSDGSLVKSAEPVVKNLADFFWLNHVFANLKSDFCRPSSY